MSLTVSEAFREFLYRIEPTERQKEDAATKHSSVREALQRHIDIERTFLTGSYKRATMIRPPNDIDLFAVLSVSRYANDFFHAPGGAQRALEAVHKALKRNFRVTPVRKDRPAVSINFSTYGFDVVPAFNRKGGGFLIPAPNRRGWISTDPEHHSFLTSQMNKDTGGLFVPSVKVFKEWNAVRHNRLRGFHLEMLLADRWPRNSQGPIVHESMSEAVASLFFPLSKGIHFHFDDPSSIGGEIDTYLMPLQRGLTKTALQSSAASARTAIEHELAGRNSWAILKWRSILGERFPGVSWYRS